MPKPSINPLAQSFIEAMAWPKARIYRHKPPTGAPILWVESTIGSTTLQINYRPRLGVAVVDFDRKIYTGFYPLDISSLKKARRASHLFHSMWFTSEEMIKLYKRHHGDRIVRKPGEDLKNW